MESQTLTFAASFGALLRLLRKRAGLTQSELARRVGYSDAQINRLEKGVRAPEPNMVAARFISALSLDSDSDEARRLIFLAQREAQHAAHRHQRGTDSAKGIAAIDPSPVSGFPTPVAELLGRDADIDSVSQMLGRDSVRLVTLIGPPGVGKTRLAIQLGRDHETRFEHGALFVPLAAVADGELMPDAVLQAMGITSNTQNPFEQVKHALHKQTMLIVLDNFEHLLDDVNAAMATSIISALLASAPHIKMLVTSRAPLRVSGEHLHEVSTLDPPVAYALFVQRAKAQNPSFKPGQREEQAIADICRRLDFLPLAIELAAARIRLFEPAALLRRLSDPFALLTVGPKDYPPRQRTLRNAIDGSYNLLAPQEQALFRRLSIFVDGFTMPMIEALAGDDLVDPVVDLAQSLVDKCMLKAEFVDGTIRFRFLEMLREYAAELLSATSEATTAAKRGAQWYIDQVRAMQNNHAVAESAAWFDWFDTEANNIRALILWSIQSGQVRYGLEIAARLGLTWRLHGPVADGHRLVTQLLAHPRARDDLRLHSRVQLSAAYIAEEIGKAALSDAHLIEALASFRQVRDTQGAARALTSMSQHACTYADFVSARMYIDEAIELLREVGDHKGLAVALLWLGAIEREQGNYRTALAIHDEVERIARKLESPLTSFLAAGWTSFVYRDMADLDHAEASAELAHDVARTNMLTGSTALMLSTLGSIALYRGDLDKAIRQLDWAAGSLEQHGNPVIRAMTLVHLGLATHLNGDSERAQSMLHEAIEVQWEGRRTCQLADSLIRLAWIAADQRRFPSAVRLMGFVEALNTQYSLAFPPSERIFHTPRLQAAKLALSQADFGFFWREGQAMNLVAAVAYALGQSTTSYRPSVQSDEAWADCQHNRFQVE